jgi:hypothetical protein
MKKNWLAVAFVVFGMLPASIAGQSFGVGARIGTLGAGGEAAVALTDRLVVRGGVGFIPTEPSVTLDDIDVTLEFPNWYNVGADFYLTGAMRIGGGILLKSKDLELSGTFTGSQDIGGQTYTAQEIGTLTGVFDQRDQVPYVILGFGKHTAPGFGLFLDLGVGFVGEPNIRLGAEGGTLDPATNAQFRSALDDEAANFEADIGSYLKLWPIFSLGLRIGLG